MKKIITLILTLCLLVCPLGVSAANPQKVTIPLNIKLMNKGEFPDESTQPEQSISISVQRYNSAAGTNEEALQDINEYLRDCMVKCMTEIPLSQYNILYNDDTGNYLSNLLNSVLNYYAELFHFNNIDLDNCKFEYTDETYTKIRLKSICVIYNMTETEYNAALEFYNNKINEIISGITPEMNDLEKTLYVHDYLVTHFQYDTSYNNYDAYSFFKTGVGVCQAYTQAFNGIMHRLGIKCTSALNNKEKHTWNIITLNGKNYHIDVTHDDPVYKVNETTLVNQSDGAARHNLFLLSDNTIITKSSHSSWYSIIYENIHCTDTTYESGYAWNEADSSFEYVDGKWYYIAYVSGAVSRLYCTDNFKENTAKCEISLYNSTGTSYYQAYCGGLTSFGNLLYYTTPYKIYCYDTIIGKQNDTGYSSENKISSCRYDGTEEDGYFALTVFHGSHPAYGDLPSDTKKLAKTGDTDGNGIVNSKDIVNTKQYLLGSRNDFNRATIDFGNKKQVSVLDLVKIKKLAANA